MACSHPSTSQERDPHLNKTLQKNGTRTPVAALIAVIWGMVALQLAEEFRQNARECLQFSREAHSIGSQTYWISMAQFWFQLAQHLEDREVTYPIDDVQKGERSDDTGDEFGRPN
jgi:hypothetical protein